MSTGNRYSIAAVIVCFLLAQEINMAAALDNVGEASCKEERRDGKDQDGNKVNCLFDACTQLKCDVKGATISNCRKETTYENARDCKAAALKKKLRKEVNPDLLDSGASKSQ